MNINIGNNNKIKNTNFIEKSNIRKEEKKSEESFWKSVLVNITSELLWKILGIVFSVGIAIAGIYVFIK